MYEAFIWTSGTKKKISDRFFASGRFELFDHRDSALKSDLWVIVDPKEVDWAAKKSNQKHFCAKRTCLGHEWTLKLLSWQEKSSRIAEISAKMIKISAFLWFFHVFTYQEGSQSPWFSPIVVTNGVGHVCMMFSTTFDASVCHFWPKNRVWRTSLKMTKKIKIHSKNFSKMWPASFVLRFWYKTRFMCLKSVLEC